MPSDCCTVDSETNGFQKTGDGTNFAEGKAMQFFQRYFICQVQNDLCCVRHKVSVGLLTHDLVNITMTCILVTIRLLFVCYFKVRKLHSAYNVPISGQERGTSKSDHVWKP